MPRLLGLQQEPYGTLTLDNRREFNKASIFNDVSMSYLLPSHLLLVTPTDAAPRAQTPRKNPEWNEDL